MLAHEYLAQTTQNVVVMLDDSTDNIRKEFHCNGCGRVLFHYYGSLDLVFPGEVEHDWSSRAGKPKIIMCKNKRKVLIDGREYLPLCKMIYHLIG